MSASIRWLALGRLHGYYLTLNALEVVQQLVRRRRLENETLTLVSHRAATNWRQRYRTAEERIGHLLSGAPGHRPHGVPLAGRSILRLGMSDLDRYRAGPDHVVSISSRLDGPAGPRHLALMDLCLDEYIPFGRIVAAVKRICDQREAWLLRTGRHYHVYGDFLLDQHEWLRWNVKFQMTLALADARYIGCSLLWGCNHLRLNAGERSHTTIPTIADELPDPVGGEIATRAMQLAQRRHACQLRQSGEPVLNHLHEVAMLALQIRAERLALGRPPADDALPEELYACGYLHDCLEDTTTDYEDVSAAAGERVARWVAVLSQDKRRPRAERHEAYRRQIATAALAPRIVKLADLLSNLRGLRGSEGERWILRYLDVVEGDLAVIGPGLERCPSFGEARELALRWRATLASST